VNSVPWAVTKRVRRASRLASNVVCPLGQDVDTGVPLCMRKGLQCGLYCPPYVLCLLNQSISSCPSSRSSKTGTITNSTAFIQYITDFHNTFQRPIWVTEWGCHSFNTAPQCSQTQTNDFMATTQAFMDKTDWVGRYSWFGAMPEPVISSVNALLDKKGIITPLGKQYIGEISVQQNNGSEYLTLHALHTH